MALVRMDPLAVGAPWQDSVRVLTLREWGGDHYALVSSLARARRQFLLHHIVVECHSPPLHPVVAILALQCGIACTVVRADDADERRRMVPGLLAIAGALEGWGRVAGEMEDHCRLLASVLRYSPLVETGGGLARRAGVPRRTLDAALARHGLPSATACLRISRMLGATLEVQARECVPPSRSSSPSMVSTAVAADRHLLKGADACLGSYGEWELMLFPALGRGCQDVELARTFLGTPVSNAREG